jgi:hypothetical protein
MLEDVIFTKKVHGKSVSILLYSIDKEDRHNEDNHNHFYEVRISENDRYDNFESYAEVYTKREAWKLFIKACKQVEIDVITEQAKEKRLAERLKPVNVLDSVTGKTFAFANHYDKEEFFNTWDRLVVDVLDREDEV